MKITTIIENNTSDNKLVALYGLSLFVQTNTKNILVDFGQDHNSIENFLALGFNTNQIDAIFVSHNHHDHIGGMQEFVDATANKNVPIYISSDTTAPLYSKRFFRKELVSRNDLICNNKERLIQIQDQEEIFPFIYACRINSPDLQFSCKDKKLRMQNGDGKLVKDDFKHELYLAAIENERIKIVSPCSHNGIINIINDAKKRFNLPISSFVGGLHLRGRTSNSLNCSKKHINEIVNNLNLANLEKLYTCHCTGEKAFSIIRKGFNNKVVYFSTGQSFEV